MSAIDLILDKALRGDRLNWKIPSDYSRATKLRKWVLLQTLLWNAGTRTR